MPTPLLPSARPTARMSQVSRLFRATPLAAAALALGALTINGSPATARPAPAAPATQVASPTSVATVNLIRVLENAMQTSQWQMQLTALRQSAEDELRGREAELTRKREDAEKLLDPDAREAAVQALALDQLRFEEWRKLRIIEVDRERALMIQSLMRLLRSETKRLAGEMGYKLVLLDDSDSPIEPDPKVNASREAQVLARLAGLRVLFADPSIDITEQVIVRLNNAAVTTPPGGAQPAASSVTGANSSSAGSSR